MAIVLSMVEFRGCRPNLEVTVLAPTVGFLRDVLGFEIDMHDEAIGVAMLHRDGMGVAVVRAANPGVNETTACYVNLTEVNQFHDACVAGGATIAVPLTDRPWGLRDFVVEVPGGHRLAFGAPIA